MTRDAGRRKILGQWLRLHLADGVGAVRFRKLREYFGSVEAALEATEGQIAQIPGIKMKTAKQIVETRDQIDVEAELSLAEKLGVDILTLDDEDYPSALKQIHDPPPVLYMKGSLRREDKLALAMVGSRNCSTYGQEQASRLAHFLAAAGFTIVSGLARGIDSAAHRGALSGHGRTLAVQGCGLAQVYPPENADLAARIVEEGAMLSELPLTFEPLATTFPMRNRIIAGLCLATIVVEARPRSGALITARLALEYNRDVMAIPGRVDAPGSSGPHLLIKEGAKLIERVEDVLDALGPVGEILGEHARAAAQKAQAKVEASLFDVNDLKLSDLEAAIFAKLNTQPVHIDALMEAVEAPAGKVNATLTGLQLKGLIKQLPGGYFQKRA